MLTPLALSHGAGGVFCVEAGGGQEGVHARGATGRTNEAGGGRKRGRLPTKTRTFRPITPNFWHHAALPPRKGAKSRAEARSPSPREQKH